MDQKKHLFCFGYGYSCDYLGHELLQRGGFRVSGTTRERDKRKMLKERGVGAYLFDYEAPLPDPLDLLKDVTHLLISTPPGSEGDPTFQMHAQDIAKLKSLEWVGYLSTIGVYGDRNGELIDEHAEIRPSSKRGSRRVKAEEQWLSLLKSHKIPLHIFRLAGIYGPGRSALDSIRAGVARRIHKPNHVFNRIHVEDIVQVLVASMERPDPGAIYNVCDDVPAPSHEVIDYASSLLHRPSLPLVAFEDSDLPPMARSFYADNKRLKNDKIKNELGISLKYPDYKQGLQGCFAAEQHAVSIFSN